MGEEGMNTRKNTGYVRIPMLCRRCGYGEVEGEDYAEHDCEEVKDRSDEEQDANAHAHAAYVTRVVEG